MSTVNKSCANDLSYLDPLQSSGSLGNTLWHIKAFGGTDFGVDQPLLEISQGCTEPLLQQAFLVLTLSGCTKTETEEHKKKNKNKKNDFSKLFSNPLPLRTNDINRGFSEQIKRGVISTRNVCRLLPMCLSKQRGSISRCSDTAHIVLKLQRRRSEEDEHVWEKSQVEKWQSGWTGRNECQGKEGEWGMVTRGTA